MTALNAIAHELPSLARTTARTVSVQMPESLNALKQLCQQKADHKDYSRAKFIKFNIPVYDLSTTSSTDAEAVAGLQNEWYNALGTGPGVVVLKNFLL